MAFLKTRRPFLFVFFLAIALTSALAYGGAFRSAKLKTDPDGVELLVGEAYAQKVLDLILSAQKKVWVALFVSSYQTERTFSIENKMLDALAKAHGRGVDVRVVLDEGMDWDNDKKEVSEIRSTKNDTAYEFLKSQGVPVRFDDSDRIMHGKFLVIDQRYSVVGSHNWTYSALKKNVEISVLLSRENDSKEVSKVFEDLWSHCRSK